MGVGTFTSLQVVEGRIARYISFHPLREHSAAAGTRQTRLSKISLEFSFRLFSTVVDVVVADCGGIIPMGHRWLLLTPDFIWCRYCPGHSSGTVSIVRHPACGYNKVF